MSANAFVDANLCAEQLALSAGWSDPGPYARLLDENGITGASWSDPSHTFLSWYLYWCDECGKSPDGWEAVRLASSVVGVVVEIDDIIDLVQMNSVESQMPLYVAAVADFAERRARAKALYREIIALVGDLPSLTQPFTSSITVVNEGSTHVV